MQTRVTVRCNAIRGLLTIYGHGTNHRQFLAEGKGYIPIELEADTLGGAVDQLLSNLHALRRTPEAEAKSQLRSKRMKDAWIKRDNGVGQNGTIQAKQKQTKPDVAEAIEKRQVGTLAKV